MVVNEYILEEVECEIKSTDDLQKELHLVLFCFVFIFNDHCLGLAAPWCKTDRCSFLSWCSGTS